MQKKTAHTDLERKIKKLEKSLKKSERDLKLKTERLKEADTALQILLKKGDEDRRELEEKMVFSVKELLVPYIEKIRKSKIDDKTKTFVDVLESNLNDFILPYSKRLSSKAVKLTHTELQIANLVKHGKTTKEIADLLSMSIRTIDTHRYNIRKKLKINNVKVGLRAYLSSFK